MKILAMADLHGILPKLDLRLDSVDIILLAGDIAPDYSWTPRINIKYQTEWFKTEFLEWATRLNTPILGCYGNHDYGTFKNNSNIKLYSNEIEGNYFLFSWAVEYEHWNYMVKDRECDYKMNHLKGSIESRLNTTLGKCNEIPEVWVCHGPPYRVCEFRENDMQRYVGSKALRNAIEKYQPKLVFVGHIHEGEREGQIGDSKIYNCALGGRVFDRIYCGLSGQVYAPVSVCL